MPAAIVDRARGAGTRPNSYPTTPPRCGAQLMRQPGLNSEQTSCGGGRRLWHCHSGSVTRMRFRCTTTVCERNGASQNVSADKSWFLVSVWSQNFRATSCPGTNQQTIRHLEQVHQRYCREDSPAEVQAPRGMGPARQWKSLPAVTAEKLLPPLSLLHPSSTFQSGGGWGRRDQRPCAGEGSHDAWRWIRCFLQNMEFLRLPIP